MTATYASSLADNTARIGELLDHSWHLSIGGTTTAAASGEVFRVISPVTREPIAEVPNGGVEDADRAVASAKKAFPLWRSLPATARADYVFRLAGAVEARARDLALLDVIDGGAPIQAFAPLQFLGEGHHEDAVLADQPGRRSAASLLRRARARGEGHVGACEHERSFHRAGALRGGRADHSV